MDGRNGGPKSVEHPRSLSEKRILSPDRNNIPEAYLNDGTRERGHLDEEYPVDALEKRRDCACACTIF